MLPEGKPMGDVTVQSVHDAQMAHVDLCNERWGQLRSSLIEFKAEIRSGIKRIWWVILISAGSLIVGQATLIVTLVLRQ